MGNETLEEKLTPLQKFEHHYNPLHLYSRLVELGVKHPDRVTKLYEKTIYKPLIKEIYKK